MLAKRVAQQLEKAMPKLVTSTMTKSLRAGKVFLDWSQNNGSKTTIAPYSLRGREHPTVAAPRTWEELDDPELRQLRYDEVLDRVARDGDLLAPLDADAADPGSADQVPQHARRLENPGAGARLAETRYRPRQYVRHPGTPRPPAALRLPAGARRRAGVVGGAEEPARDHRRSTTWRCTPRIIRWNTARSRAASRRASTARGKVIIWDSGTYEAEKFRRR